MNSTFYEVVTKDTVAGIFMDRKKAELFLRRMAAGLRGYIRMRQRHHADTTIAAIIRGNR
jgi:hypothetical protein